MPGRDTAQLILEVDARIATAQRAVSQLAQSIQRDATGMDKSLGQVEKAHARLGRALNDNNGRLRAGFTQLSFQIGDVTQQMSLGVSGARIFAQQSGQVIQALQVMGGEGNKFLRFLGGPWGIAVTTAAVILAPLATKLFETGDEVGKLVDKMRDEARQQVQSDQAHKIFERTLEGVEQALRAVDQAYAEYENRLKTSSQLQLDAAKSSLAIADARRQEAKATLAAAKAEIERQDSLAIGPETKSARADPHLVAADQARARIAAAEAQLSGADAQITHAQQDIEKFQSIVTVEKATASAADKINKTYDELIEKARRRAVAEHKVGDELKRQVDALQAKRTADLKALEDGKRSATGTGELATFIMPVQGAISSGFGSRVPPTKGASSFHPAIDIAAPLGTPVKAAAGGTVIYTGKLGGLGNVVIVDHGGGTITEYGHLSAILTRKGASVGQGDVIAKVGSTGISTGPHLDYRVKVGGKYVDPRKGKFPVDSIAAGIKAGNSAESAEDKAVRQANAFSEESARLDQELLRAKSQLVQGVDAEADAAVASLQAEQESRKAAFDNDVKEGKLSAANAEILKAKVDQITFEKLKAVELQRQLQKMERQSELEQRSFQYQVDDLRFADEMARTQADHRRLQLQILDVVYQQKEAALRELKARLELAGKIEEAAAVQAQIDRLPTDKDHDRRRVEEGTMNPLEAWAHDIPKTAEAVIEAMQAIEARGLDSLADAITEVVMGTKSLKDAFKDVASSIIADILRMTIKMLIFRALSSVFGNIFGGGGGGGDILSSGIYDGLPGIDGLRANGGPVQAGGSYIVGERGPELFVPGASGTIVPRVPKVSARGLGRGGEPIELIVHTAPSKEAWARVEVVAQGQAVKVTQAAAPTLIRAAAKHTTRSLSRPRL